MSIQVLRLVHPYIRTSSFCPIDITVEKASVLAVCGANGSGKTTFLKLLLNELQPQSGQIKIDTEFSYLGTKNGLKSQLLIRQQLPYFLCSQSEFPWPHLLDKVYKNLSSGQQRLVALWLVLHSAKPLIFLDEPFSYLDANSFKQSCTWINTQLDLQKTIVFTHHSSEEIKNINSLQILDLNEW